MCRLSMGTGSLPRRILLAYHCASNTGYAIGRLEKVFHSAATRITGSERLVWHSYTSLQSGQPTFLDGDAPPAFEMSYDGGDQSGGESAIDIIRRAEVECVFAFDMPIASPVLPQLRNAGVRCVISYWGASISGVFPWWLRPLRRMQYHLALHKPDHFVFESEGMRRGATHGAMIPRNRTTVCPIGVDLLSYSPEAADKSYPYDVLDIPGNRSIVFFSGHLEERKGLRTAIRAMRLIVEHHRRADVQLVIAGGTAQEVEHLSREVKGTPTEGHVTFCGYRDDIARLHHGVSLGIVPSTGWDSFTVSSVELMASGVPLLVSSLPGLSEAVTHGVTGLLVTPGDVPEWAAAILRVIDDAELRRTFSTASRLRAQREHSREVQIGRIEEVIARTWKETCQ